MVFGTALAKRIRDRYFARRWAWETFQYHTKEKLSVNRVDQFGLGCDLRGYNGVAWRLREEYIASVIAAAMAYLRVAGLSTTR